jgi:multicomponent Na+:H+ antiporter subunit C
MYITITACLVILIGLYGIITSRQIVKTILCMNLVQTAAILLLLSMASSTGQSVPIVGMGVGDMVDPLPQALMITAIVIGASVTALGLFMSGKIFHYYGSLSWYEIFSRDTFERTE